MNLFFHRFHLESCFFIGKFRICSTTTSLTYHPVRHSIRVIRFWKKIFEFKVSCSRWPIIHHECVLLLSERSCSYPTPSTLSTRIVSSLSCLRSPFILHSSWDIVSPTYYDCSLVQISCQIRNQVLESVDHCVTTFRWSTWVIDINEERHRNLEIIFLSCILTLTSTSRIWIQWPPMRSGRRGGVGTNFFAGVHKNVFERTRTIFVVTAFFHILHVTDISWYDKSSLILNFFEMLLDLCEKTYAVCFRSHSYFLWLLVRIASLFRRVFQRIDQDSNICNQGQSILLFSFSVCTGIALSYATFPETTTTRALRWIPS